MYSNRPSHQCSNCKWEQLLIKLKANQQINADNCHAVTVYARDAFKSWLKISYQETKYQLQICL